MAKKNNLSGNERKFYYLLKKERLEYKNETRFRIKKIRELEIANNDLKHDLDSKDDWIRRLLNFTELTKEDLQLLLDEKKIKPEETPKTKLALLFEQMMTCCSIGNIKDY